MIFHPPLILAGYVAFTVPFAFAVAALVTRRLGEEWLRSIRHWTLLAWLLLGAGNLFGAQWAYVELGLGWILGMGCRGERLTLCLGSPATAFLFHTAMIQRRARDAQGMEHDSDHRYLHSIHLRHLHYQKRSAYLSSHLGQSALGPFFLTFISITLVGSLALVFSRLNELRGEDEFDSLVSRESSFLINNLILAAAAFAVFLGTFSPSFQNGYGGRKSR